MKFTAIDFETANSDRGSVCAVGLVMIENGQVTGRLRQLIRPDPCYFDPFNVSIHGISEADVADAPTFPQFWPSLWPKVSGPLVAHNASFDMSVLRHVLDRSDLQYPDTDYFCTRVIAKLAWPQHPTYALDYIANVLGIAFHHHDAEEDAQACALIAVAACRQLKVLSLYDLQDACGLRVGRLFSAGYRIQLDRVRRNAGFKSDFSDYPNNAGRHTYATMALQKYQSANKVALMLGHTTTGLLFDHYKALATPQQAEQYWNIKPELKGKVIQFGMKAG